MNCQLNLALKYDGDASRVVYILALQHGKDYVGATERTTKKRVKEY